MVFIETESWANTNLLLEDYAFNLKSQQQIWDILQGASPLEV